MKISSSSLIDQKRSLKSVRTVVHSSPVLSHDWAEDAVKDFREQTLKEALVEQMDSLTHTTTVEKVPESSIDIVDLGFGNFAIVPKSSKQENNSNEKQVEYLVPENDWKDMHGFLGQQTWSAPIKISHSEDEARPGYTSKRAHEFEDVPEVLSAKVALLAQLIRRATHCMVYSGAGISTSSGINDYASKPQSSALNNDQRPKLRTPYEAQPTLAHHGLVALYRANHLHYWVQQNHDGLPQKAGLPQYAINEIHGAWYDPSNPVVPMNGSLRTDLFQDLLAWEDQADLTISMGTTMCGMNSDRVFTTVATKSISISNGRKKKSKSSSAIGGVIINLQQTQYDSISCLRIFSKLDIVMEMLVRELGLPPLQSLDQYVPYSPTLQSVAADSEEDVFRVRYDQSGYLIQQDLNQQPDKPKKSKSFFGNLTKKFSSESSEESPTPSPLTTTLDLRVGSRVKLVSGPRAGDEGEVVGKNREGHYRIQFMHRLGSSETKRPFQTIMGSWWIEAAVNGTVPSIPIVNCL